MTLLQQARERAEAWLTERGRLDTSQERRDRAIGEELVAFDVLDLIARCERLEALVRQACDIADDLNGDNGDDEELHRRRAEIAAIRAAIEEAA